MPMYEYECAKCHTVFEALQKFSDEPLKKHEGCGGKVKRLLSTPSFHFKGSGFYITDYKKSGGDGKSEGASSEKASESKGSDSKNGESKNESRATESAAAAGVKTETKSAESKPAADSKSESKSESKSSTRNSAAKTSSAKRNTRG